MDVNVSLDFGFPSEPVRMADPLTGRMICANTVLRVYAGSTNELLYEYPFADHLTQTECGVLAEWFSRQVGGGEISGPQLHYSPPGPALN